MILSVWKGTRKPRLYAGKTPVASCVAFRAIELEIMDMDQVPPVDWKCSSSSKVWTLRLEGLVCILDCVRCSSDTSKSEPTTLQLYTIYYVLILKNS